MTTLDVHIDDRFSVLAEEASAILERLTERLSPTLLAALSQLLDGSIELVRGSNNLLGTGATHVESNDASAPRAGDVLLARFEPGHGLLELVSALRALDGDLQLVLERHRLLPNGISSCCACASTATEDEP